MKIRAVGLTGGVATLVIFVYVVVDSILLVQARSQQFAKGGSTVDISAIDRTYIFIYMYIIYNYVAWYVNRTICMRI